MNNQVNEVLDKIREVCDLKRLEFGSLYRNDGEIKKAYGENYKETKNQHGDKLYTFDKPNGTHTLLICFDDFEVIGKPPQLNHLLLALGAQEISMICGSDTTQLVLHLNDYYFGYNLQKSVEDNLRSNPELTKWVHGMIIGNE